MAEIATLVLVGLSVGLGNFAASVAIGLDGVSNQLRWRIAVIFGLFETGMPIIGLVLGASLTAKLGGHANLIGAGLLGLSGLYLAISSQKDNDQQKVEKATKGWGRLIIVGLSLSIDNLIVGFGLGVRHPSLWLAALIIGTTCIFLSLLGLEIGNKLNSKVESYSTLLSGLILMLVGALVGLKIL